MTNGNEEWRIYVGIGESAHNASTSDDMKRGDTNGKGGRRAYLDLR